MYKHHSRRGSLMRNLKLMYMFVKMHSWLVPKHWQWAIYVGNIYRLEKKPLTPYIMKLKKMELYGARNNELSWFQSYLSNRLQCCKVNGKLSKLETVTCGVAQGSCLGPVLFILYLNDLLLSVQHSQVNMYADDTCLSFSAKSIPVINERVNEDLECLKTWLAGNKLSLNVANTQSLIIGSVKIEKYSANYGSEAISCNR